jgi:hypothetical protein
MSLWDTHLFEASCIQSVSHERNYNRMYYGWVSFTVKNQLYDILQSIKAVNPKGDTPLISPSSPALPFYCNPDKELDLRSSSLRSAPILFSVLHLQ